MSTKQYFIVVLVLVFSILGAFYSGLFLKDFLTANNKTVFQNNQQLFQPNFIDELIIITEDKPHKVIILSGIRTFVSKNINNYTVKAFFYDGTEWTKDIQEGKSDKLESIPNTRSVPKWEIVNDPSYMLRQSVSGDVFINDTNIKFDVPIIENEISVRSFYKYTKFMSEANGSLSINGVEYPSRVLYSRIYSFNPPESLVFTSDPSGIETEWLGFWDTEGNFYSIDETVVDNKITKDTYKAHSLGIYKSFNMGIQKSFELDLTKDSSQNYSVEIKNNINKIISVKKLDSVNKSISGNDIWVTGTVSGTVKTKDGKIINGFGIYEQISQ